MQSKLLGSSTQPSQEQSPATGAAGQPKAIPPSPNAGVPRPGQILKGPRRPLPWLLEAAPELEEACVIARCNKHRAWFAILLVQQDAETWKAVRARKISDEEAVQAMAEPGGVVGQSAMDRVSGTMAFSVPCP
ncbi:MAG: hypothetical protein LAP61_23180 [Acidobacteriia bacterium]|nr:hypothetical protein [Terriglobia bacterium]